MSNDPEQDKRRRLHLLERVRAGEISIGKAAEELGEPIADLQKFAAFFGIAPSTIRDPSETLETAYDRLYDENTALRNWLRMAEEEIERLRNDLRNVAEEIDPGSPRAIARAALARTSGFRRMAP